MADTTQQGSQDVGTRGPWPGPEGLIPEPPRDAADANAWTRRYLDSILIEERLVGAVKADTTFELWGRTYASPIMMPAFSHLNKAGLSGRSPMEEYAEAARDLNLVNWVGMEPNDEFARIVRVGAPTVRVIKPFADHGRILDEIAFAQEQGAIAVGIDIDHVFGSDGRYDVVDGAQMGTVTADDLARYAQSTPLPLVAKGVLSEHDARLCAEAGCRGVFVSHHHGRMPYAVPPVMVLPQVRAAVGPDVKVFVDCGISSGADAFKALALGADAVAVGRGMLPGLLKQGAGGVIAKATQMREQLRQLMGYTGMATLADMDPSVLHVPAF